jgi:hypothetical protein
MLKFKLKVKCNKSKAFKRDCVTFKTSCKLTANQEVARINLIISSFKESVKYTKKSKQDLLKSKDVKQKNLKANTKMLDQIQALYKKLNVQEVISISNLNGDLMAKIWECDMLKKENKVLNLKVALF